jgi:hypothetical protein
VIFLFLSSFFSLSFSCRTGLLSRAIDLPKFLKLDHLNRLALHSCLASGLLGRLLRLCCSWPPIFMSRTGLVPHRSDAILISLHNASLIFEILGPQSMEDLMEKKAESQLGSSPAIPLPPSLPLCSSSSSMALCPLSVICQSDTSSIFIFSQLHSQANRQDNSFKDQ